MELKFCRGKEGVTSCKGIINDINKIKELQKIAKKNNQEYTIGIVVVFSKVDKKSNDFEMLLQEYKDNNEIQLVYCTGDVIFE
ncbi:MAG: hypothetical protein LBE56_07870 [Tannerella sp.]|jgi:hypothetical protein|nr:hypothetical protein [Tannerella sp.]